MWLAGRRASRPGQRRQGQEVENLLYAGFLGVFLAAASVMSCYNYQSSTTLYLYRVWDSGMSFHGGLIGVILVMVDTGQTHQRNFLQVADLLRR
ncbi:prolipoprotein diacylglyceryl transferase family protein [Shigella flexneri]